MTPLIVSCVGLPFEYDSAEIETVLALVCAGVLPNVTDPVQVLSPWRLSSAPIALKPVPSRTSGTLLKVSPVPGPVVVDVGSKICNVPCPINVFRTQTLDPTEPRAREFR